MAGDRTYRAILGIIGFVGAVLVIWGISQPWVVLTGWLGETNIYTAWDHSMVLWPHMLLWGGFLGAVSALVSIKIRKVAYLLIVSGFLVTGQWIKYALFESGYEIYRLAHGAWIILFGGILILCSSLAMLVVQIHRRGR